MAKENIPEMDQDQSFINEFTRMNSEGVIRDYEKKHRGRISEASFLVKDAFDKKWHGIIGTSYFQPVTTVQPVLPAFGRNNTERSDPRSRKYTANILFDAVYWQRIRRKIGKKVKDLFILEGKVAGTETVRPIYQNLTVDRLKEVIGPKEAEKIIIGEKGKEQGELSGTFNILVEGYWEVQFSPAKSENDPIDVRLMWEGQCLIVKRMTAVVLPGFYIEVADNATRDHYVQSPEQGRKKIGVIQEYPYTVFREATREEYLAQKSSGDAVMRDKINRQDG